jgi:uncharacterized membrane protein
MSEAQEHKSENNKGVEEKPKAKKLNWGPIQNLFVWLILLFLFGWFLFSPVVSWVVYLAINAPALAIALAAIVVAGAIWLKYRKQFDVKRRVATVQQSISEVDTSRERPAVPLSDQVPTHTEHAKVGVFPVEVD